jgi:hypothetical protein
MSDPKKKTVQKPIAQTFGLDLPALGELRLELEEVEKGNKPRQAAKKEVNKDLIHRLITCVKNM